MQGIDYKQVVGEKLEAAGFEGRQLGIIQSFYAEGIRKYMKAGTMPDLAGPDFDFTGILENIKTLFHDSGIDTEQARSLFAAISTTMIDQLPWPSDLTQAHADYFFETCGSLSCHGLKPAEYLKAVIEKPQLLLPPENPDHTVANGIHTTIAQLARIAAPHAGSEERQEELLSEIGEAYIERCLRHPSSFFPFPVTFTEGNVSLGRVVKIAEALDKINKDAGTPLIDRERAVIETVKKYAFTLHVADVSGIVHGLLYGRELHRLGILATQDEMYGVIPHIPSEYNPAPDTREPNWRGLDERGATRENLEGEWTGKPWSGGIELKTAFAGMVGLTGPEALALAAKTAKDLHIALFTMLGFDEEKNFNFLAPDPNNPEDVRRAAETLVMAGMIPDDMRDGELISLTRQIMQDVSALAYKGLIDAATQGGDDFRTLGKMKPPKLEV